MYLEKNPRHPDLIIAIAPAIVYNNLYGKLLWSISAENTEQLPGRTDEGGQHWEHHRCAMRHGSYLSHDHSAYRHEWEPGDVAMKR